MFVTVALGLLVLMAPRIVRLRARPAGVDEQQFCSAVYAELRAGASLRDAIAQASLQADCAELRAIKAAALGGASINQLAAEVGRLPTIGTAAAAAVRVAALSGGRAAGIFLRLADRAAQEAETVRQKRVLTAQARMSAAVVCGIPALWLALGGFGQLRRLVAAGGGVVVVVGLGLQILGVALVWRLASA